MNRFQFGIMDLLALPAALLPSFLLVSRIPIQLALVSFTVQGVFVVWALSLSRSENLYLQKVIWVVLIAWLSMIPATLLVYMISHFIPIPIE